MNSQRVDCPPTNAAPPVVDWDGVMQQGGGATIPPFPSPPPNATLPNAVDAPPLGGFKDAIEQETAADMRHNRDLRERYADKAYSLAFGCLWWWAGMLVAVGFVNGINGQPLWSDKVIIAVTTGVTVSVLAAFLGVIRGLFPNGNGSGSKGK